MNTNPDDRDPIATILAVEGEAVLAFISGVEGPSYRPFGAMMAINSDGIQAGNLSSGCIDSDDALHAMETLRSGKVRCLRYGRGSPFFDIQLPCGGGLDILLLPRPYCAALREVARRRAIRQACSLIIDSETGAMDVGAAGEAGWDGRVLRVGIIPKIRFLVFGTGPEARIFAMLAHSMLYPTTLYSPESELHELIGQTDCDIQNLSKNFLPDGPTVDERTAIVLFFHDHIWEPPLLAKALETQAFYIGAQGSRQAANALNNELRLLGVSSAEIARIKSPFGLIPSARDARTLAISVLAEVLAQPVS